MRQPHHRTWVRLSWSGNQWTRKMSYLHPLLLPHYAVAKHSHWERDKWEILSSHWSIAIVNRLRVGRHSKTPPPLHSYRDGTFLQSALIQLPGGPSLVCVLLCTWLCFAFSPLLLIWSEWDMSKWPPGRWIAFSACLQAQRWLREPRVT